jgi:hypothetical protein
MGELMGAGVVSWWCGGRESDGGCKAKNWLLAKKLL